MAGLMITAAEFERRMREINEDRIRDRNEEKSHQEADRLMCEVLKSLGYDAGVRVFEGMPRWYI